MPIPQPVAQLVRGFAMGAADIVPGVSGGTVALVVGIYDRLIRNVRTGARCLAALARGRRTETVAALRRIEWVWLVSLGVGVLSAIAVLSSLIEGLLADEPVKTAGVFFGLVAGSLTVAWRMIDRIRPRELATMVVIAAALFVVLGLRTDTEVADGATEAVTRSWGVFLLVGAIAICAMILPGISGSFILVMLGMYTEVLGAVNDRDVTSLVAFAVGCVIGLAVFSSVLHWALEVHHDLVMAAMVGLMVGSLRVLWPWPGGTTTTTVAWPDTDPVVPVLLAVVGFGVVIVVERVASRSHRRAAAV